MSVLKIIGLLIFAVGAILFVFGKKFFFLRVYFGDRSMFTQMFWGSFLSIIGLIALYFSGVFN